MKLCLVQHGEALSKEVDPERRLSEGGRQDIHRLATFFGQSGLRVRRVMHSGKARARQTAEILAAQFAPQVSPEPMSGLAPMDPPSALICRIEPWNDDSLLVGHQPFMGRLVSRLLCGNEGILSAAFLPGTAVCLERDGEERWSLAWMVRPELLKRG